MLNKYKKKVEGDSPLENKVNFREWEIGGFSLTSHLHSIELFERFFEKYERVDEKYNSSSTFLRSMKRINNNWMSFHWEMRGESRATERLSWSSRGSLEGTNRARINHACSFYIFFFYSIQTELVNQNFLNSIKCWERNIKFHVFNYDNFMWEVVVPLLSNL